MAEDSIVNVALGDIHFDDAQPRLDIDEDQLGLLQESMRQLGRTVQYITVARREDGTYLLMSGERRVRAARALGWHHLPAVVVPAPAEPGERLLRQVAENTARAMLRPSELCDAIGRLRGSAGSTDIAAAVGLSVRTVYNYLSILEHPDLVEALRHGRTLRSVLAEVAVRSEPPEPETPTSVGVPLPPRLHRSISQLEVAWPSLDDATKVDLAARLRLLIDPSPLSETGDRLVNGGSASATLHSDEKGLFPGSSIN
ncbi:MAG: ParB/RepB/Spo0J family partition protein [Actinomycetota bacterium]|nr:ParB/RepB/Spo0J family partition protein [Actinomycetota bacterium]